MNIKRMTAVALFAMLSAIAVPTAADATVVSAITFTATDKPTIDAKEAARIVERVKEIQQMDKSNLSAAEKQSLRNELKDMKQKAASNRGIYISLGAALVIILLLILILR